MATELESYYQSLAEVYIQAYDDESKRSKRILTAMGVIVSMHSELLSYRLKNSSSDKVKKQEERLMLLEEVISDFSVISDRNFQLRHLIAKKDKEAAEMMKQLQELTDKIESFEKQIQFT